LTSREKLELLIFAAFMLIALVSSLLGSVMDP